MPLVMIFILDAKMKSLLKKNLQKLQIHIAICFTETITW